MGKKKSVSVALFVIAFIAVYLILCFVVPGLRIKLEATPREYFFKSITHMVAFKSTISLVIALILSIIPMIPVKKKQTKQ